MKELIETIAKSLVEHPEEVQVEEVRKDGILHLVLKVDASDVGKVIGKQGRIARAIRTVTSAAAIRAEEKVIVDID